MTVMARTSMDKADTTGAMDDCGGQNRRGSVWRVERVGMESGAVWRVLCPIRTLADWA